MLACLLLRAHTRGEAFAQGGKGTQARFGRGWVLAGAPVAPLAQHLHLALVGVGVYDGNLHVAHGAHILHPLVRARHARTIPAADAGGLPADEAAACEVVQLTAQGEFSALKERLDEAVALLDVGEIHLVPLAARGGLGEVVQNSDHAAEASCPVGGRHYEVALFDAGEEVADALRLLGGDGDGVAHATNFQLRHRLDGVRAATKRFLGTACLLCDEADFVFGN